MVNRGQFYHIKRMITISVITLNDFHCNYQFICDQQTLSFEFGNEFALTLDEVPQLGLHEPVGLHLRNDRTVVGLQQLNKSKITLILWKKLKKSKLFWKKCHFWQKKQNFRWGEGSLKNFQVPNQPLFPTPQKKKKKKNLLYILWAVFSGL